MKNPGPMFWIGIVAIVAMLAIISAEGKRSHDIKPTPSPRVSISTTHRR